MRVRVYLPILILVPVVATAQKAKMTMEEYRDCVERRGASACMEANLGIKPGSMNASASPVAGNWSLGGASKRQAANGATAVQFSQPVYNLEPDWQVPVSGALPPDYPRWRFAYPSGTVLIGVRLKQVVANCPELLTELLGAGGTRNEDLRAAMESMSQVEELWLSVQMTPGRQPSMLVLASGEIPEAATDHARAAGVSVRYVDSRTIVMGARADVNAAVARLLAKGASAAPRQDWAESDLLFSGRGVALERFAKDGRVPAGVNRLTAGMNLREAVTVRASLETSTPAAAKKILAEMEKDAEMRAMLPVAAEGKLQLAGSSILVSGQEPLAKAEVRRGLLGMLKPVVDVCQQISVRKKTAVIVGLEGGPKAVYTK